MIKAGILAAGSGTRLKSISDFKPITKIYGTTLIDLTYLNLQFEYFHTVKIIFNDEQIKMDKSIIKCLKNSNTTYFHKTTKSSMHSLLEISNQLDLKKQEHFYISMVDSIVKKEDAKSFIDFCNKLNNDESAILVTEYIDDESPLTLKVNTLGEITAFQCDLADDVLITSGVYCFSEGTIILLKKMVLEGHTKMRNFLSQLLEENYKIKVFKVKKTLDIDRPEDIKNAELFLSESNNV